MNPCNRRIRNSPRILGVEKFDLEYHRNVVLTELITKQDSKSQLARWKHSFNLASTIRSEGHLRSTFREHPVYRGFVTELD